MRGHHLCMSGTLKRLPSRPAVTKEPRWLAPWGATITSRRRWESPDSLPGGLCNRDDKWAPLVPLQAVRNCWPVRSCPDHQGCTVPANQLPALPRTCLNPGAHLTRQPILRKMTRTAPRVTPATLRRCKPESCARAPLSLGSPGVQELDRATPLTLNTLGVLTGWYVLLEMPRGYPGARRAHLLNLQEWYDRSAEPLHIRAEASVQWWPWPPGWLLSRLLLGWALPCSLANWWSHLQVGLGSLDVIPAVPGMGVTAPPSKTDSPTCSFWFFIKSF